MQSHTSKHLELHVYHTGCTWQMTTQYENYSTLSSRKQKKIALHATLSDCPKHVKLMVTQECAYLSLFLSYFKVANIQSSFYCFDNSVF